MSDTGPFECAVCGGEWWGNVPATPCPHPGKRLPYAACVDCCWSATGGSQSVTARARGHAKATTHVICFTDGADDD